MHNLGEQHMNAIKGILRYLKNAPGKYILMLIGLVQWMIGDPHLVTLPL